MLNCWGKTKASNPNPQENCVSILSSVFVFIIGGMATQKITIEQLRTLTKVADAGSYQIDSAKHSAVMAVRGLLTRLAEASGDPSEVLTVSDGYGQVRLTERGKQLLPYAEAVIGLVDELHKLDRKVRVAVYSSLMLHMLESGADPAALDFEFVPADAARAGGGASLIRQLSRHDIDLAVAPAGQKDDGLEEETLYFWELRAVGRLPDTEVSVRRGRRIVTLKDLAKHPLLVSPPGYHSRQVLEDAARGAKVSLQIRFELADQGLMQRLTKVAPANEPWIAVMPGDAYGIPEPENGNDVEAGVTIVAGNSVVGDSYSVYRRASVASTPTEFEQRVAAAARTVKHLLNP